MSSYDCSYLSEVLAGAHLGVARDIVASTLVLLLKTTLIPGNSAPCFQKINCYMLFVYIFGYFWDLSLYPTEVKARMLNASRIIRQWAHANSKYKFPARWNLNRNRLSLKTGKFCHYLGKGWHCIVLMNFLEDFLANKDFDPDIKSLVWSGNHVMIECPPNSKRRAWYDSATGHEGRGANHGGIPSTALCGTQSEI